MVIWIIISGFSFLRQITFPEVFHSHGLSPGEITRAEWSDAFLHVCQLQRKWFSICQKIWFNLWRWGWCWTDRTGGPFGLWSNMQIMLHQTVFACVFQHKWFIFRHHTSNVQHVWMLSDWCNCRALVAMWKKLSLHAATSKIPTVHPCSSFASMQCFYRKTTLMNKCRPNNTHRLIFPSSLRWTGKSCPSPAMRRLWRPFT